MAKYDRQIDLFDPANPAHQIQALVVGAGTIGSWLTLGLAKLGVSNIVVLDDDTVEEENISNQLYSDRDAEYHVPKVIALRNHIYRLTGIEIKFNQMRVEPEMSYSGLKLFEFVMNSSVKKVARETIFDITKETIVFMAVDSIESREYVFRTLTTPNFTWIIDGRMAGQFLQIYAVKLGSDRERYETTLLPLDIIKEPEAWRISNVPCTQRSIVDASFAITSVMTRIYRMIAVGDGADVTFDISLDMRNLVWFKGIEQ